MVRYDGTPLLALVGCPPIRSFLRAERLRTWRAHVYDGWTGSDGALTRTYEVEASAVSRWLEMVDLAVIKDEPHLPNSTPGLDSAAPRLFQALSVRLLQRAGGESHMIEYARWLRGILPLLEKYVSSVVLDSWRDAIKLQPDLPT
jgi:hypothetical protein